MKHSHVFLFTNFFNMSNSFSHLDENGQPGMVDVSAKNETVREARAQSIVYLGLL